MAEVATEWTAQWMWAPERRDQRSAYRMVAFRRIVDLDCVPTSAPCRISADSRYLLCINGVEVGRGPVRCQPLRMRHDSYDLTPYLVEGRNVVAITARYYGTAGPTWMPHAPTVAMGSGAVLFEAQIDDSLVLSDGQWRCGLSDAWTTVPPVGGLAGLPLESIDARLIPADWQLATFDDDTWPCSRVLTPAHLGSLGHARPPVHPYGAVIPRPIGGLGGPTTAGSVQSHRVVAGGDASIDPVTQIGNDERSDALDDAALSNTFVELITFDFGHTVVGGLVLQLDGVAGTQLDIAIAEGLHDNGNLDTMMQHAGLRYIARGDDDHFESFETLGGRYVTVAIRGSATITSLAVRSRLCPNDIVGSFTCSDELLNEVWAAGRRTVDHGSLDSYVDCPTREQRAWVGDSVVHQMVDLATNADWRMARWWVELAASPRNDGLLPMSVAGDIEANDPATIPDYTFHWIRGVYNLWRYDPTFDARRYLTVAARALAWFEPYLDERNALRNVPGWILIDWAAVSNDGASASLTALYARALRDVAEISTALDDYGQARWATTLYERIHRGFDQFYDQPRQLYVDHLPHRESSPHDQPLSQHTNATAIAAGLVPVERWTTIVAAITDDSRVKHYSWLSPGINFLEHGSQDMYTGSAYLFGRPPAPWWNIAGDIVAAQPFYRYVVHDALAAAGRADLIPRACRDWQRLLKRDNFTLSEVWSAGSHCHAWSATPTRDLIVHTLGISPDTGAGFHRARVAPNLGDLGWVSGSAPTPHGVLRVAASPDALDVDTPIDALVITPWGERHEVGPGLHHFGAPNVVL
jgi:alpha-L-rhamnosidase